jgi:hypothetical protein
MTPLRRKLVTCVLAVAATAGMTIGFSSTAQAATNAGKWLCADINSDYSSYARSLENRWTTFVATPGRCVPLNYDNETLDVFGRTNSGSVFSMGRYPRWKPPANIMTAGKVSNRTWTWWTF